MKNEKLDLIYRDEALEVLCDCCSIEGHCSADGCAEYQKISKLTTVDAVPVVHGRWEKEDQSGISIDGYMVCSACNVMIPKPDYNRYCLHRLNFCPNCGADMRGDRDGRKDP